MAANLVAVIALIYFAWHVASKDDIKELRAEMNVLRSEMNVIRSEMNRGFSELRGDIKELNQDYKDHLFDTTKRNSATAMFTLNGFVMMPKGNPFLQALYSVQDL